MDTAGSRICGFASVSWHAPKVLPTLWVSSVPSYLALLLPLRERQETERLHMCVCICVSQRGAHATELMWRSEDNFLESIFPTFM